VPQHGHLLGLLVDSEHQYKPGITVSGYCDVCGETCGSTRPAALRGWLHCIPGQRGCEACKWAMCPQCSRKVGATLNPEHSLTAAGASFADLWARVKAGSGAGCSARSGAGSSGAGSGSNRGAISGAGDGAALVTAEAENAAGTAALKKGKRKLDMCDEEGGTAGATVAQPGSRGSKAPCRSGTGHDAEQAAAPAEPGEPDLAKRFGSEQCIAAAAALVTPSPLGEQLLRPLGPAGSRAPPPSSLGARAGLTRARARVELLAAEQSLAVYYARLAVLRVMRTASEALSGSDAGALLACVSPLFLCEPAQSASAASAAAQPRELFAGEGGGCGSPMREHLDAAMLAWLSALSPASRCIAYGALADAACAQLDRSR